MAIPLDVPKAYFVALFCEAIMQGIYTMILVSAIYLILRGSSWKRRTPLQMTLVAVIILMYCFSTLHISLLLRQCLIAFFQQDATMGGLTTFNDPKSYLLITQPSLEFANCLIGDSIVIWRTWILWGRGWKILVFPITLLLVGVATGIILLHAYATSAISTTLYSSQVTFWLEIFGSVTFCINFYAICVISYRAWLHEKTMKSLFRGSGQGGIFYRVVLILVESGMIYCITLLIIVALISAGNDFGVLVVLDILSHLTGIYPSLILIIISLELSSSDHLNKAENNTLTSMRFSGNRSVRQGSTIIIPDSQLLEGQTVDRERYPMHARKMNGSAYTSTGSSISTFRDENEELESLERDLQTAATTSEMDNDHNTV